MNSVAQMAVAATLMFGAVDPAALAQEAPAKATTNTDSFAERFEVLTGRFETAQREYHGKLRALFEGVEWSELSDAERAEIEKRSDELSKSDPSGPFALEFKTLAVEARGTATALKSWMKTLELASNGRAANLRALRDEAIAVLLAQHLDAPELEEFGNMLGAHALGAERFVEVMTQLREKSPHARVQASASFALARHFLEIGDAAKAGTLLRELIAKHAATPADWGGTYGKLAERALFEAEHLQIGMLAPDFEALDETGAKFKVSDYRGKVVVLDFWGYW